MLSAAIARASDTGQIWLQPLMRQTKPNRLLAGLSSPVFSIFLWSGIMRQLLQGEGAAARVEDVHQPDCDPVERCSM